MSFINPSYDTGRRFKAKQIVCPNCTEPNLNLKWHRRNEQGKMEYWDIDTDSLHLCKTKYLKDLAQCKRCHVKGLRWYKKQLYTMKGKLHECDFSYLYKPLNEYEIEQIEFGKKYYNYYYVNG